MNKMRICFSTLIWSEHPFEVAVREIASLGGDAIELGYWTPKSDPMNYGDASRIVHLLKDMKLKVPLATLYCGRENREKERLRRLAFAAEVGCRICIVNGMGQDQEEIIRNLGPLLKEAERLNIRIAYENHFKSPVEGLADMETLSARIESENFGFIVAPQHLGALGESTAECIRRIGKRVLSCYLWDVRSGYDFRKDEGGDPKVPRFPFAGEGKQDFREIISALYEIGFQDYLDLMCLGRGDMSLEKIRPAVERAHLHSLECISYVENRREASL